MKNKIIHFNQPNNESTTNTPTVNNPPITTIPTTNDISHLGLPFPTIQK